MNLLQSFLQYTRQHNLFGLKDNLLLAVSGGVDSVVLCELCKQADLRFSMAHCNFQLREEESDRDEKFVRLLGEAYHVDVLVQRFDTQKYTADNKLSIQVAARELRYNWFMEIMNGTTPGSRPQAFSRILTAHHADDNIETVLMNFFKGTGIAGMRGILPRQGAIVRPLLFAHKETLLDFATVNNLSYVEDSSNLTDKYTRNYFRHVLMPGIEKVFPNVKDNLAANAGRFRQVEQLYLQSIEQHKKKLTLHKGNEVHIPVLKLKKTLPLETVLYEIIRQYGFTVAQVNEVINLMGSGSGKYIQSTGYRIIKHGSWLIISPVNTEKSHTIVINQENRKIKFDHALLECKEVPVTSFQLSDSPDTAQLDAAEIVFPLLLRKQKQGDYFYPLGMQKKKKLNRFFFGS